MRYPKPPVGFYIVKDAIGKTSRPTDLYKNKSRNNHPYRWLRLSVRGGVPLNENFWYARKGEEPKTCR